ncbi:MAG: L-serine ammonia-lyase, iron-sulfur-dependent, subunit alpha [Gordonibacter pamelaeae]|uniref:L-serine ammonia-lyase, iron-sulfur-dependent, subunit alpha n=1 Tax=Gordonibacter pamelaeae TaxID=471189 RepID=UPI0012B0C629|nr:L-serine ammonia-lyase, iron-sulfur-dependent, subunit alpha [Gordonibacter pamelaeae]MBS4894937.1 L-serine ammonia-lyase, iron-sulfur-dependent, subunit alpha [Gordonibacter pamelaeae]MCQ4846714.1 L-serine ammonia-lyase, iron-sulfur-dependent, subunit alpha [Gordonibacter pamelaeae]MCQ4850941.1 L-serine ammonia-lyase, iron-sulfur-dependent, subunit alpha [Gordonibacter pamelaeae]MSA62402.1 L-serine ammonia-lyase, iron-sulfur-dependent, subunit alpha [Gordonibacter pamelaeae]GKG89814.1 hypo
METLGFADIVGPIMVGPSSSHTAGALRIARMARSLLAAAPARAEFTLYGSFAHTQSGHGTDKALVAGLLGLAPDDLGVRDSFERAHAAGLAFSFACDREAGVEHPNTVDARIVDAEGGVLEVRGVSVGGGAAVVTRIDGIDVNVTGEHTSVVVRQRDETGVLAHIAGCFSDCAVNIATTRMYRTRRGSDAFTVMELDGPVPAEAKAAIERHPAVRDVRIVPADGPAGQPAGGTDARAGAAGGTAGAAEQAEERFAACDFASGAELLDRCAEQGTGLAGAFLAREQALAALDGRTCDALPYADRALAVMRASATEPLREPAPSMGGLIGGEARDVRRSREQGPAVVDGLAGAAMEYALAVLETNASMGRIVAAPTAGSAGVVPGVLLALEQERGLDAAALRRGLLAAGAVGYLIARNATVSGAEGGCQAEIGAAAAMAAAAAVEMAGGTPAQALDAAANALSSLMGLVCDPVGGLVEVPCQKRNATAAATALVSAQIALAGVGNLVGFDETVAAMDAVGRTLPFELRESALGGIAAAPSACAWCAAHA